MNNNTLTARQAYAEAVDYLGGNADAEDALEGVLQHVINGGRANSPRLAELVTIMLADDEFMEGFND